MVADLLLLGLQESAPGWVPCKVVLLLLGVEVALLVASLLLEELLEDLLLLLELLLLADLFLELFLGGLRFDDDFLVFLGGVRG